jgi:hypothetical protein
MQRGAGSLTAKLTARAGAVDATWWMSLSPAVTAVECGAESVWQGSGRRVRGGKIVFRAHAGQYGSGNTVGSLTALQTADCACSDPVLIPFQVETR